MTETAVTEESHSDASYTLFSAVQFPLLLRMESILFTAHTAISERVSLLSWRKQGAGRSGRTDRVENQSCQDEITLGATPYFNQTYFNRPEMYVMYEIGSYPSQEKITV